MILLKQSLVPLVCLISYTLFALDKQNFLLGKYALTNVLYSYNSDLQTQSNFDFQNVLHAGVRYIIDKKKNWSYEIGVSLMKANYVAHISTAPTPPSGNNNPVTKKQTGAENQENREPEFYSFPLKLNVHFLKYGFIGFGPKVNLTTQNNNFDFINQLGYVITLGAQFKYKNSFLLRLTTDFDNHSWYLIPQKKQHHLFFSNSLGVSVGFSL